MDSHVKYLIFSSILIIVCFLLVPIVFFYQDSDDRHDGQLIANEGATGDDPDFPDEGRKCSDYYYPCDKSLDSENRTICIPRSSHCDKRADCPNGEDEVGCDTAYLLIDLFKSYNASIGFNVTVEEKYRKNFYHNCSLFEVIEGRCSCNFSHSVKADCKHQQMREIPPIFQPSITSLNLDHNDISHIDERINRYTNLSVVSLRHNRIRRIPDYAFVNLTRVTRLYLRGNLISDVGAMAFAGLISLEKLYINDNRLKYLSLDVFSQAPRLKLLDLAQNSIRIPDDRTSFPHLPLMDWLDLSDNRLDHLSGSLLKNLHNLTKFHVQGNVISSVDARAFRRNRNLTEIILSRNRLSILSSSLFSQLTNLLSLNLDANPGIDELPVSLFHDLTSLKLLNLTDVRITNINRFHFSKNANLTHLLFSRFKYCLFAPQVRICQPSSDGVSSRHHLLVYPILRIAVWIVAFITCVGNFVVFTWRSMSRNEDAVLSLFVKNLSFADLLTGIYLTSIGLNDIGFHDEYLMHALDWMGSWKCSAIGILAMVSAEVSVLILTILAFERYRSIVLSTRLLNLRHARILMAGAWLVAGSLAVVPLLAGHTGGEVGYYGSNGLCFPLHIDDPFAKGWRYSAFVFLGVNFSAVVSMLLLYGKMFRILNQDRKSALPGHVDKDREDMVLAVRFFFIVFTDCMCWLPIVLIKILAFVQPDFVSPTIYAWVVVFILPINSAINPIIYTIAAPTSIGRQLKAWISKYSCPFVLCCSFGRNKNGCGGGSGKRNSSTTSTATGVVVLGPSAAANLLMRSVSGGQGNATATTMGMTTAVTPVSHERKRSSNGSVMSVVTMNTFRNVSTNSSRRNSSAANIVSHATTSLTKGPVFPGCSGISLNAPADHVIIESPVHEKSEETMDQVFVSPPKSQSKVRTLVELDSQVFV